MLFKRARSIVYRITSYSVYKNSFSSLERKTVYRIQYCFVCRLFIPKFRSVNNFNNTVFRRMFSLQLEPGGVYRSTLLGFRLILSNQTMKTTASGKIIYLRRRRCLWLSASSPGSASGEDCSVAGSCRRGSVASSRREGESSGRAEC